MEHDRCEGSACGCLEKLDITIRTVQLQNTTLLGRPGYQERYLSSVGEQT